uniref:Uncharacterized protein n=1 Tax=Percolomonas cosmopolitus TaxID=63605 RepID=A0A7S1KU37_9EUKA
MAPPPPPLPSPHTQQPHRIHVSSGIFTQQPCPSQPLFPLHSLILELTLELAEILSETVLSERSSMNHVGSNKRADGHSVGIVDTGSSTGTESKVPLLFSAGSLFTNIPIHSHAQFRNFLLHADFSEIEEKRDSGDLFKEQHVEAGLVFCTDSDLVAWTQQPSATTTTTTTTDNMHLEAPTLHALKEAFTQNTWDAVCVLDSDTHASQWKLQLTHILGENAARRFHFCTQEKLRNTWLNTIKDKYGLIELKIEGIPMKQQKTSDTTDDYEVPLLCRASSWHITQNLNVTNFKTLKFEWRRNDPNSNIYAHHMLSDAFPVVALQPNSNVSKCLMSFIGKGRAATVELIYEKTTEEQKMADNNDAKPPPITTHMITKQGNQAYIHVLSSSTMFDAQCTQNKSISDEYRYEQLFNLISQQNMIRYHPQLTPFKNKRVHELKELAKQEMTTMRHNGFLYHTPKYVEKLTRIFPLHFLHFTILWNDQIPQSVYQSLKPLFKIIYKDEPTEADIDQARVFLSDMYRACTANENYLFPHLKEDHKKRYYMHKKMWYEVRILLTAFKAERLLRIMDHLWPNFFFDPAEENQSTASRNQNGTPALPFSEDGPSGFTLESLGTIVHDRSAYHDQLNIYPVGYRVSKMLVDLLDPTQMCKYIFSIQDGGESPIFVIQRDQTSEHIFQGKTPSGVFNQFANAQERLQGKPLSGMMPEREGLQAFGLINYTVQRLIADLPNSEKCERSLWSFPHAMQREPNNFEPFIKRSASSVSKTAGVADGGAKDDIANIGEPRKNASDNTNVTFAIQTQTVYSQHRDAAVLYQKKQLENAMNSFKWREGVSLFELHALKSEKSLESRAAMLGTHKQLYADMYANEDPIMDSIISQQQQLSSNRKKKNKKRKSQNSESKRAKRRRKQGM